MDSNEPRVPASLLKMEIAENEQLRIENDELKKEVVKLKKMITAFMGGHSGDNKMDSYVAGIKAGNFKPALRKDVTIDDIVKIIYEEGITDKSKIAEKLHTSQSTIYRRLNASKLLPINEDEIKDYYEWFIKDESGDRANQTDAKWANLMSLDI